ncbi:MAG: TadE family protein [Bryobacteraceae bacterium]|jgi:hypothetical protein
MRRARHRGVSIVEFCFVMLVLTPLLLGTIEVGFMMILSLQTIQLARDAGHMYARGSDFSQPGNQTILTALGSDVGLSATAGAGSAVVILSTVTYVDQGLCAADGKVDGHGNPSGCTNYTQWVFTQRLTIGKSALRSSNFGSPVTTGANPVTIAANGSVSLNDQVTNAGDVATFNSIDPYQNNQGVVSGLPSGQVVYIAEAAAQGFSMPPFANNPTMYSFNLF